MANNYCLYTLRIPWAIILSQVMCFTLHDNLFQKLIVITYLDMKEKRWYACSPQGCYFNASSRCGINQRHIIRFITDYIKQGIKSHLTKHKNRKFSSSMQVSSPFPRDKIFWLKTFLATNDNRDYVLENWPFVTQEIGHCVQWRCLPDLQVRVPL